MTKWKEYRLDELGFVGRGKSRHRPRNDARLYDGPYPLIQTADIMAADPYISDFSQTYSEFGLQQSKLWPPDTLCITIAGANTAETAILKFEACFPDSVIGFRPDPKKSDLLFVKYSLDQMKNRFRMVTRGATQDNLSMDKLLSFPLRTPPLEVQKEISKVLSTYDDLIENNRHRIKILEETARSLYREWFIYFRYPGHESVPLVSSPLGPIPKGWDRVSMLDCPYFHLLKSKVRKYDGLKTYFETADISGLEIAGDGEPFQYEDLPSRAQMIPKLNSVWFARMQETYKVLFFLDENEPFCTNSILSSGFVGFEVKQPKLLPFLFCSINTSEFHKFKDQFCTGATQRSLTNEGLGRILIISPCLTLVEEFGKAVGSMLRQLIVLQMQNKVLRKTRDLLLPRLLSGQIPLEEKAPVA